MSEHKKKWSARHKRILILYEQGKKAPEIAREVGMNCKYIYDLVKTDKFSEARRKFESEAIEKAREIFNKNLVSAAFEIVRILTKGKAGDRIRMDAAREILDRAGLKPKEVIETIRRDYTPEEVESARKVAEETARIAEALSLKSSRFVVPKPGTNQEQGKNGTSESTSTD